MSRLFVLWYKGINLNLRNLIRSHTYNHSLLHVFSVPRHGQLCMYKDLKSNGVLYSPTPLFLAFLFKTQLSHQNNCIWTRQRFHTHIPSSRLHFMLSLHISRSEVVQTRNLHNNETSWWVKLLSFDEYVKERRKKRFKVCALLAQLLIEICKFEWTMCNCSSPGAERDDGEILTKVDKNKPLHQDEGKRATSH